MNKSYWNLYAWKLRDVILASLIATLFAVICFATVHTTIFAITPLIAPLGLGDIAIEFVFGVFFFSAVFAAYIMQKPGVALVVGTLTGFVQVLMGTAFASTLMPSAFIQGLGAEVVFALFRYKRWNLLTVLLAALNMAIFSFILAWYRGLWVDLGFGFVATRFVIRAISALVISGVLAKFLADRLAKAGVLKSYPLAARYQGNLDA